MNRAEAIKVLSSYDVNGVWADVDGKPYNAEEQAEAFDMAIEALKDRPSEYNTISIENEPYTTEYAKGYNDAKREIALSGEYERAYQRGKADAIEALQTDIVHCEECKHYDEGRFCWHPAAELGDTLATEPTDSCSYGERREDKDYERAIEQMEHDTLYESTYSPEDGSM